MVKSRYTFYDPETFVIIVEAGQEITDEIAQKLRELGFHELAVQWQEAMGIGRCKRAWAWVRLCSGEGKVTINGKLAKHLFGWLSWRDLLKPFEVIGIEASQWDIDGKVEGSACGSRAQMRALQHAIAGAIAKFHPEKRQALKQAGFCWRKRW